MKTIAAFFLAILLFSGCIEQQQQAAGEEAFFCPKDNCAQKLIGKFRNAKQSIDVAVYSFTLDEISAALVSAKNRGVKVRVIIDAVQAANSFSEDEKLQKNGVPVKLVDKAGNASMHNKFAVIDKEVVATGSFNYTKNANESNDENLVFLFSAQTAQKYSQDFDEIWSRN